MARQQKRSRVIRGDSEPRDDVKRARQKNGRQHMRTVTRTARRKRHDEVDEPEAENDDERQSEDELDEREEEDEDEAPQAYNALLTLLKSDHKVQKAQKKNKSKVEDEEELEDEEDKEDEIAGANMEEEDDEEEHADSDDSDAEEDGASSLSNAFDIHFNLVSESYLDQQEKVVLKEKSKWSVASKEPISDSNYIAITTKPPGEQMKSIGNTGGVGKMTDFKLKNRLVEAWNRHFGDSQSIPAVEARIGQAMFSYQDINYPYGSYKNNLYRKMYVLHALNHIFTTRDKILKNSAKLHAFKENGTGEEPEFRDQGFTRPKVLVLLPTRNACNEVVELLIQLSGSEQQENKKKFTKQFYSPELPPANKPDDFKDQFKGNNNDFFCLGVKFTRKALKLYSSFYSSDIILASPIGLSMILESPDKRKRQYDFLSSIEVLVVDRANHIEMQNWDHVSTVLKYINKIPKEFHDADFSRIRMWCINDQSRLLRQTLVFSEYSTPNINNLISAKSHNLGGKVRLKPVISASTCIMNSIGVQIKQIFQRFDSDSPVSDPEMRFKYFINSTLPSLMKSTSYTDGIMIYIPSYYDYLRVKHHMKTNTKFLFGSLDEYSSQSKMDRVRRQFLDGKIKVLLYTERLHFFRRFEIHGVKTLLMYGMPSNPVFYKELVRMVARSVFKEEADLDLVFVKVLYSKLDAVALERVVGAERSGVLCNSVNEVYEFR